MLTSLRYHWRTNLAVACGVAVGTAVLTGALLVGDSMHGSLRHLTLDRLGRIDEALVTDRFFRAKLAEELAAECGPHTPCADAAHGVCRVPSAAVPAILLRASLENPDPRAPARANRVDLIGCDERFWQLGSGGPTRQPGPREIVLNQPLAEQLGVRAGNTVLLRLPRLDAIPADSPLGKKRETVVTQRLTVSEVIPAEGLGRFGLRPTQQLARNAYVPLDWLAERLEQPGGANAIFAATSEGESAASAEQDSRLEALLRPTPADYGLTIEKTPRGYVRITSDRMILSSAVEEEIVKALSTPHAPRAGGKGTVPFSSDENRDSPPVIPMIQPAFTYLANTLAIDGREIPYSTVTAVDFADRPPLGPFLSTEGKPLPPLGPDEIALNSWAADDLHAKVGDTVRVAYFEPESIEGHVREKAVALRLAAIVQLAGAADDRSLTPTVKGMTDEVTMSDWDPPFPFNAKRIRPADEKYWDRYGPTPKAFVSLETGRRLWGSRFGQTTSIRIAVGSGDSSRRLEDRLTQYLDPAAMGFVFQPVKRQALAASDGATPFGVLFLSFSFFIIAAAVMLVALLFRLGIEQRASQIGTLMAVGWPRRKVGRLLLGEGLAVAALGSLLGVPVGIGYAALMLLGLRTWWLAAVVTPFLRLYMTSASLAIGSISGLLIAMAAIWLSVRTLGRLPPRRLLAGQASQDSPWIGDRRHYARETGWVQWMLVMLTIAPTVGVLVGRIGDEFRAGAFFAAGGVALVALLTLIWIRLRAGMTGPAVAVGGGNLARMALRNAARNPGRSTLTIGLVAAACFLIVAVSAFRVDPAQQTPTLAGGNGGFALVAESDQPILHDLNSAEGRRALGFSLQDEKRLADSTIIALRVKPGDDASCLNLYRSRQPRVLGLPRKFIDRGGFAWADKPSDCANPWLLLEENVGGTRRVPLPSNVGGTRRVPLPSNVGGTRRVPPPHNVGGTRRVPPPHTACAGYMILEKNTANYALGLWGGLSQELNINNARGEPLRLQVAALLADSIFQGDLLISERAFLKHFPETNGYRFFLVETPPGREAAVRQTLERNLGDYGFAAETTGQRLAGFLTVQNTYLSTFQSLGGLGLLLGTLGLAAVQLRSMLERRGELALLRATGFRRRTLARLVLLENAALLVAGLAVGLVAALLAVLPHALGRGASIPWASLALTLAAVLVVGLAAGSLAVHAVLRAPLLPALREEL
jgi:ABC-type antimicrobial peptide transport system permease subunit